MRVRRRTNSKLLRDWIEKHGPGAKQKLVHASNYAFTVYAIDKILGTGSAPRADNQRLIARVTGLKLDELFPEVRRSA